MTMVPAVVLTTACLPVISAIDCGVVNSAGADGGAPRRCADNDETATATMHTATLTRRTPMAVIIVLARSLGLKPWGYWHRRGIVREIGSEPALGLVDRDGFARGVRLQLIATDPADIEVLRRRMSKIQSADRCGWKHGAAVCQRQPLTAGIEDTEQLQFLAVIRTGRISVCRTDPAILLRDQIVVPQGFVLAIAPIFPRLCVEVFRKRFGEPIRERLHHDRVVVVVIPFEFPHQIVGTKASRDREHSEIIRNATLARSDEVRQR